MGEWQEGGTRRRLSLLSLSLPSLSLPMVLLTYTRALDTRLAPLLPLLPPELLQLVQFYSSSSSTRTTSNDDRSTESDNIDHSVLVKLSTWVKKNRKDLEDKLNESSSNIGKFLSTLSNSLSVAESLGDIDGH